MTFAIALAAILAVCLVLVVLKARTTWIRLVSGVGFGILVGLAGAALIEPGLVTGKNRVQYEQQYVYVVSDGAAVGEGAVCFGDTADEDDSTSTCAGIGFPAEELAVLEPGARVLVGWVDTDPSGMNDGGTRRLVHVTPVDE